MNEHSAPLQADKSRRYRERKRAAGLREVRLWLPNVTLPAFQALARQNAAALRDAPEEAEAAAFIAAALDAHDWAS